MKTEISTDSLQSSIAFKGSSATLLTGAIEEVRMFVNNGELIYPPTTFPTVKNPVPKSSLQARLEHGIIIGPITPPEAVAIKVLLDESSALAQAFGTSFHISNMLSEALNLPQGGWQHDVIEGISELGYQVGIAAGVREQMLAGNNPKPDAKTWKSRIITFWHSQYALPLEKDGMTIGVNTTKAIQEYINQKAETEIPSNPEGAKGSDEVQNRISSRKRGTVLGGQLYLEALGLATHVFPENKK